MSMGEAVTAAFGIIPGSSVMEGEARQSELKQEALAQKSAGQQDQVGLLTDLQRTVGAIQALSAQRGVNPDSPSVQAYTSGAEADAYSNIYRSKGNSSARVRALRLQAADANYSGYSGAIEGGVKAAAAYYTGGAG